MNYLLNLNYMNAISIKPKSQVDACWQKPPPGAKHPCELLHDKMVGQVIFYRLTHELTIFTL